MMNPFKSWFSVDKRILGIYRIFFGLLIFADIARRWSTRYIFYSNDGIVHHYKNSSYFSLFNFFDFELWMIDILFIVGLFFSILFIIGYKTKLSHLISGIILLSLHNRVVLVENAGDFVLNCMIVWTFFLPLGSAISLDALKLSLKSINDSTTVDLNNKIPQSNQYCSIAYFAILFQISAIYFFTGVNKTGIDWTSGTALYYFYQLDTFLTPFGALLRNYVGYTFSKIGTYIALITDFSIPLLLLSPIYAKYTRLLAILSLTGFHLIVMSSVSIGLFSQIMMTSFILLIDGQFIDWVKSYFKSEKYILFYDSDCGFCHYSARIIKRLDVFNRITFENQYFKGETPDNFDKLVQETAILYHPVSNQIWLKNKAFAKLTTLFPIGFLISWIFYLPGAEELYNIIANHRTKISTSLGLAACNIKSDPDDGTINDINTYIYKTKFRIMFYWFYSFIVFILLLACINYNLVANKGVNEYMEKYGFEKFTYIKPLKKMMSYPRMIQRWNMFAPNVLKTDKWLIVEATLSEGYCEHDLYSKSTINLDINEKNKCENLNGIWHTTIDPFTGKPPVLDSVEYEVLWKDINQFWRKYFTRIEKKTSQVNKFKEWLVNPNNNYFVNTIGDRHIDSVKIYFLTQRNSAINSNKTHKLYKRELPKKIVKRNKKKNTQKKNKPDNILDIIRKNNKKIKK